MSHELVRAALVGTAPSWRMTPWADTTLPILSLNDAWQIDGFERADEWYDFHPLDHFYTVPQPANGQKQMVYAHDIPLGQYVRPERHLDWLATQTIPVWLHPDYVNQHPTAMSWPMARAFPKAEIEAHFGRYFTSTPAWVIAHAILRGIKELHIYGIHLATESEYIEQRPNFEYLIGMLLGRGKPTLRRHEGLRYYESPEALVVLPEQSPVLSSNFQYAFEPSPRRALDPLKWQLHKAQVKRDRRLQALKIRSAWQPWVTYDEPQSDGKVIRRRESVSSCQQQVAYYDAVLADVQEQMHRITVGAG